MRLLDEIKIRKGDVVSIVGGGGKTSTMNELAKELKNMNYKVLVTSTTAIMMPKKEEFDYLYIQKETDIEKEIENLEEGTITVLVKEFIRQDKVKGLEIEFLDNIIKRNIFDIVIIEADGARMKTIKAPREDEPLLTKYTTKTIGVFGIDSIGLRINDNNIHRAEMFLKIIEKEENDILDDEDIVKLIESDKGIFKKSKELEKYLIVNKCDSKKDYDKAVDIRNKINIDIENFIITSFKEDKVWK